MCLQPSRRMLEFRRASRPPQSRLCPLPCAPSDAWGAVAVVQDSRCVRPFDCRLRLSFVRSLALCLSQTRAIAPQHRGDAPPPRPPPLPLSSLPPFPPSPSSCMHPRKPCGRAVNSSWARIKDPPSARAKPLKVAPSVQALAMLMLLPRRTANPSARSHPPHSLQPLPPRAGRSSRHLQALPPPLFPDVQLAAKLQLTRSAFTSPS